MTYQKAYDFTVNGSKWRVEAELDRGCAKHWTLYRDGELLSNNTEAYNEGWIDVIAFAENQAEAAGEEPEPDFSDFAAEQDPTIELEPDFSDFA